MKTFPRTLMNELAMLFNGYVVIHEHSAEHVCISIDEDERAWNNLGYRTLRKSDRNLFLQSQNGRCVELVLQTVPQHEAWAVDSGESFQCLIEELRECSGGFKELPEMAVSTPATDAAMFCHLESGNHIQIIYRSQQIFDGVFDD